MKNDDHDFGGKMNGGDAEADSPIGRELEARIVAAVAGEASAFEAAELERIAAENPAVAEFKQRIESVHGLVTEAARPDAQPLRLSAERRAKVLAVIGAKDSAQHDGSANVAAMNPASKSSRRWRIMPWALAIAAAACIPFFAVFFSSYDQRPARPDPAQTVIRPGTGDQVAQLSAFEVRNESKLDRIVAGTKRLFQKKEADENRKVAVELSAGAAGQVQMMEMPPLAAPQAPVNFSVPDRGSWSGQITGQVNQLRAPTPQNFVNSSTVGGTLNSNGRIVLANGTITLQSPDGISSSGGAPALTLIGPQAGSASTVPPVSMTFGADNRVATEKASEALARYSAYDSNGVAFAPAATPAPAVPPASDIVKMDAFEVSASREGSAMAITASRAANILPTPTLPVFDLEKEKTAVLSSSSTASTGALAVDDPARDLRIAGSDLSDEVARLRKLNQAPAAGQQVQEAVALNEGVIKLSAFQVSSDKDSGSAVKAPASTTETIATGGLVLSTLPANNDFSFSTSPSGAILNTVANENREQDRLAQERAPQQELAKKRAEEAKAVRIEELKVTGDLLSASADNKQVAVTEASTLNLGSIRGMALTTGTLVGGEKEKADAPLVRAKVPADESLRLETTTATQSVSTFSLHVSDVSFRLAQAALARGEAPDPAAIRPEEFYNAFNYGDPVPAVTEKVGSRIEQSAHPFLAQRNLLRIALKVAATGRTGSTPLHLTVLLDTSGSMEREDRAATVRQAMGVLVSLLGPNDRLTLIGFARQPRLLAENLSGDRAREVLDIIARTPAEGGTNMEEALKLAMQLALRHRDAKAQNRIVMLTDGAANLGNAVPEQLATRIEELRQRGIAFDACGVGLDGLDDGILEALTRKGDGRYTVLNSPDDAGAGFAQKLAGAFRPAAENVKVQVRFNPARVATYRLIGFEQHRLQEQDFRNDKVDAAELAAEEAGVALYQFEPLSQGEGDVGEVFVRFRDPATGAMVERSWMIPYEARVAAFDRAAPSLRLAGVAAMLAEKLRNDSGAAQINLRDFATVMSTLQTRYRNEPRVQELATMVAQTRRLTGQ